MNVGEEDMGCSLAREAGQLAGFRMPVETAERRVGRIRAQAHLGKGAPVGEPQMAVGALDEERASARGMVHLVHGRVAAGLHVVETIAGDPVVRASRLGRRCDVIEQGAARRDAVRADGSPTTRASRHACPDGSGCR